MRKIALISLVLLVSLAFGGLALAQPPKPAEKPKLLSLRGEIKAVDSAAKTVTVARKVKGKEVETVVKVADDTEIMVGKEKKALGDLEAGNRVTIRYEKKDGDLVAKSITVSPPPMKAGPAEPAKPAEKK